MLQDVYDLSLITEVNYAFVFLHAAIDKVQTNLPYELKFPLFLLLLPVTQKNPHPPPPGQCGIQWPCHQSTTHCQLDNHLKFTWLHCHFLLATLRQGLMNLPISQITQFVLSFRIILHNFHGSEAQIHVKILDNKQSLSKKNATLVVNAKASAMTGSYLSWSFLTCSDKSEGAEIDI